MSALPRSGSRTISRNGSATVPAPSSRHGKRFTLNIGLANIAESTITSASLQNSEGCSRMPSGAIESQRVAP